MELLDDSMNEVTIYEVSDDIICMKNALEELTKSSYKPKEYKEIFNSIIQYLKHNCRHSIVNDDIDIDYGEKSICISYCEHCFLNESLL